MKYQTYQTWQLVIKKKTGNNGNNAPGIQYHPMQMKGLFWPFIKAPSYRVSGHSWLAPGRCVWQSPDLGSKSKKMILGSLRQVHPAEKHSPIWWSIALFVIVIGVKSLFHAAYQPKSWRKRIDNIDHYGMFTCWTSIVILVLPWNQSFSPLLLLTTIPQPLIGFFGWFLVVQQVITFWV